MKNCTCDKLNCDVTCLCNCHRKGETRIFRVKSTLDIAINLSIERMQKYNLKIKT